MAKDYEIKFTRPEKVGEKYNMSVSGGLSEKVDVMMGEKVIKKDNNVITASFDGVAEVMKVDDSKRAIEYRVVVDKCEKLVAGKPVELLAKGKTLVVKTENKKNVFHIDGKAVDPKEAKILSIFFSLPDGKSTDDDIFGSKERKKVGDSWPANKDAMIAGLPDIGLSVKKEDVSGKTVLEKLETIEGVQCLILKGSTELKNFSPPLPAIFKAKAGSMAASYSSAFPLDVTKGCMFTNAEMKVSFSAKGKPGPNAPEITMVAKMTQFSKSKWRLIK